MATGGNPLTMRGNPIANSTMMTPGRNPEDWRATLARIDELEAALRGGAAGSSNLGKVISEGIINGMSKMQELTSTREKRARSPEGGPEAPITDVINIQGSDDNHRQFCWELRRRYKQPNAKPEEYWSESNSRVADSGLARRLAERVPELHTAPTPASLVWWGLAGGGGRKLLSRLLSEKTRVETCNKILTKK